MKILTSWDDGAAQDLRLAELLSKYTLPGIFYWPWDLTAPKNMSRVSRFLTHAQCRSIAESFQVGSHGMTHVHLTRVSPQEAEYELTASKSHWEQFLGRAVTSFCYPRGYSSPDIRKLVQKAGYADARTVEVGHLTPGDDPFAAKITIHIGIKPNTRKEYPDWKPYARQMLAKAGPQDTFHLIGHSWEIQESGQWAEVEDLFKELKDKK